MVCLKKMFVIGVVLIILIPILSFNFLENCVSQIDNRYLTKFPLGYPTTNLSSEIENYVNDRIGFRDNIINFGTELNNILFHNMEHPSYEYGKNDYVFFKLEAEKNDEEFIDQYVSFITKIKKYCDDRSVPFLYVIDPSKTTVYKEYLPEGYNYKNTKLEYLRKKLKENNIEYVDNVVLLEEKSKNEQVFNKQFDAGHWNRLGGFYGVNNILLHMKKFFPDIQLNKLEDFNIGIEHKDSLPVSKFPISENVPKFELLDSITNNFLSLNNEYSAIKQSEKHKAFNYNVNNNSNNSIKTLYFQGSYLNEVNDYLWPSVHESISVHAYENVIDFDYYFNIFQPDIVVFESAEYATTANYYSIEKIKSKNLNPILNKNNATKVNAKANFEYTGNIVNIAVTMNRVKKIGRAHV